jgi:PAS domain S-box-containing protein
MLAFRDRPIKQKLVITTMVTTTVALLVAGLGVVITDYVLYRDYVQRDLSSLARIIADNSTAALAFNDPDSAAQTLAALRARTHIAGACIYRAGGSVFARYSPDTAFTCPPPEPDASTRFAGAFLVLGQPIMLSGRRIGSLTLFFDMAEINGRVRLYGGTVLVVLLGTFVLAFFLSSWLRSVIARPISQLVSATTSVSQTGDYSIRAEKQSADELGVLVDRFNEMLAGIQSRDEDLKKALVDREVALAEVEKQRERFEFMAESMPQKIFTASPTGESLYLNRLWVDFTGLPYQQLKDWGWVQFIHPEDLEESLQAWRHAIETGEPLQLTNRFRRADGVYRWHLNRARAMRNAQGEITLWVGSSTEIQEQKEAEEELRRANEDLQQFAYSASHDLQEPIRNVAVYSEIVARRYQNVLDAEGRRFLEFMREGGRRLAALVNDLLAYTRASMAELSAVPVSASQALDKALAGLAEAIRESRADITSDPLPDVHMSDAHLQQIFQNLIGNALKYKNEDTPRVHISAVNRGGQWCFAVKDNGIGIDPQYKEKIFGVFKRLHHDQKYSGTGIGLAICQRVVERYGGRIWVESEAGKGSTFYFTIPQYAKPGRPATAQSSSG